MASRAQSAALVSVVMPAHDAARYIEEALTSVLSQTHSHLEIIVVDDGSTDSTADIVTRIARSDSRLRLIRQQNSGPAAARNTGISQSRGELIAPIDADDVWHPEKLESQVAAFQTAGSGVAVVYSWVTEIDEVGQWTGRLQAASRYEGNVLGPLLLHNFIGPSSNPMFRRDAVEQVGGYPESFSSRGGDGAEDHRLLASLAGVSEFRMVPSIHVAYRVHGSGISTDVIDMRRGHDRLLEEVRRRSPELPPAFFQWSSLLHAQWMARRAMRAGDNWGAMRGLRLTVRNMVRPDPWLALRLPFRELIRPAPRVAGEEAAGGGDTWAPDAATRRSAVSRADRMARLVTALATSAS